MVVTRLFGATNFILQTEDDCRVRNGESLHLTIRIRCYYHKWENLDVALDAKDANEAKPLFWGMRDARTYSEANTFSDQLENVLKRANLSTFHSY